MSPLICRHHLLVGIIDQPRQDTRQLRPWDQFPCPQKCYTFFNYTQCGHGSALLQVGQHSEHLLDLTVVIYRQPSGCIPPPYLQSSLPGVLYKHFCLLPPQEGTLWGIWCLPPCLVDWHCLSLTHFIHLPTAENFVANVPPSTEDPFMCDIHYAHEEI